MKFKITSTPKGKKTQFICTADGVEIGKRCSVRDCVKCVVMSDNETGELFVLSWHASVDAKHDAHSYSHIFTLVAEVLATPEVEESIDAVELPSPTFNSNVYRLQKLLGSKLLPSNF